MPARLQLRRQARAFLSQPAFVVPAADLDELAEAEEVGGPGCDVAVDRARAGAATRDQEGRQARVEVEAAARLLSARPAEGGGVAWRRGRHRRCRSRQWRIRRPARTAAG